MVALVPLEHWLYHLWDGAPNWGAQWAEWCFGHLAGIAMSGMLLWGFLRASGAIRLLGVGACLWMALEDAECAACGALKWSGGLPNIPSASRLCIEQFGNEPYIILCAAAISYLLARGVIAWNSNRASLP